jgi:hypothetical protein
LRPHFRAAVRKNGIWQLHMVGLKNDHYMAVH